MFCEGCGAQMPENTAFCPNCGKGVTPPSAGAGAPPPPPPPAVGTGFQASGYVYNPPDAVTVQTGKWIGEAWGMVKSDLGTFIVAGLLVAIVGGAVPVILQGAMIAGFHIFIATRLLRGKAEIGDLFKGFNYFVPALVASLLISIFVTVGIALCILPGLVVAAGLMFSYLFIIDKRMDFWPAMQASWALVSKNFAGFTLFWLALAGLQILGVLACIVGVFITIPIMYTAITIAYRDLVGFEPNAQF